MLWSKFEKESVIWLEESVLSLVFSLSWFSASSVLSAVQNTVKAIPSGMDGRQGTWRGWFFEDIAGQELPCL